jgi:TP901 family phage tail tape measure protein
MALDAGDIVWNIGADVSKLDKALDKAHTKVKGFGKALKANSKAIGLGMTLASAAITGAMGLAVSSSLDFSKAMAEVNTLGVKDLEVLGDSVKDVSMAFGLDLVDSANAAYQAISAGASEAQTPLLLEQAAIAATAGVTELSTAIELGTSVTNAFGMGIDSASKVFDEAFIAVKGGVTTFDELSAAVGKLSPIMSAAGLSSGEMFASIGALTKGGIATAEAVTGMKAVIAGILKPTSDAEKMAKKLGIEFNITALKAEGLGGFMDKLKKATGGNIEQMGAFFASTEALGAALALTGAGAESFTDLLVQMKDSTGASQEAFDAFVDANPGFALEQLKTTIKVLAIEIGDHLAPILSDMAEKLSPIIKGAIDFVKANGPLVGMVVTMTAAFGALMLVLGPLFIMLPGIISAWGLLSTAFGAVALVVGPMVAAVAGAFGAPVWLVIVGIIAGITAAFLILRGVFQAASGWVKANWDRITKTTDAAKALLTSIWNVLKAAAGVAFAALRAIMEGFSKSVRDQFNLGAKASKTGSKGFLEGVQEMLEKGTAFFDKILGGIEQFRRFMDKHWEGIVATVRFVSNSIIFPIGAMVRSFKYLADGITRAIKRIIKIIDALKAAKDKAGLGNIQIGAIGLATGGVVKGYAAGGTTDARLIKVGERGPELMAAPIGSRVLSHPDMMKAAASGQRSAGNTTLNATFAIDASGIQDPVAFFEELKPTVHDWLADGLKGAMA